MANEVTIKSVRSATPSAPATVESVAASAPEVAAGPVLKGPHDWARVKGLYFQANPLIPQVAAHYDYRHACADVLHNWSQYAYHYADKPFVLTEADYDLAVEAALHYPNKPAHVAAIAKGSD